MCAFNIHHDYQMISQEIDKLKEAINYLKTLCRHAKLNHHLDKCFEVLDPLRKEARKQCMLSQGKTEKNDPEYILKKMENETQREWKY